MSRKPIAAVSIWERCSNPCATASNSVEREGLCPRANACRRKGRRHGTLAVLIAGIALTAWASDPCIANPSTTPAQPVAIKTDETVRPAAPITPSLESEIIQRKPPRSAAANRAASPSPVTGGWVRLLQPIIIVFGIMAVLTWAGRRWLPQARQASTAQSVIRVLARQHLSGKQSLCLVKLGPSVVLLGITPEHISNVLEVRDPDEAAALVAAAESAKGRSFTKAMAAFSASPEQDEPVEPEPRQSDGATASSERIREMVKRVRAMSEDSRGRTGSELPVAPVRAANSGVRQIS